MRHLGQSTPPLSPAAARRRSRSIPTPNFALRRDLHRHRRRRERHATRTPTTRRTRWRRTTSSASRVAAAAADAGRGRHQRGLRRRRQRRRHATRTTSSSSTTAPAPRSAWPAGRSSTPQPAGTTWQVTPLTGSIPAGRNYLVQEAAGAGGHRRPADTRRDGHDRDERDGRQGRPRLDHDRALTGACPTGATIVDFVGYGTTANCFEGSGPTPALEQHDRRAAQRRRRDRHRQQRRRLHGRHARPASDRRPGADRRVDDAGQRRDRRRARRQHHDHLQRAGRTRPAAGSRSAAPPAAPTPPPSRGGPTTFTLDPDADFAANESCTVTVLAADVTDQDTDDPPDTMAPNYVFTFQTADVLVCGDPATPHPRRPGLRPDQPARSARASRSRASSSATTRRRQPSSAASTSRRRTPTRTPIPRPPRASSSSTTASGLDVQPGDLVRVRGTVDRVQRPAPRSAACQRRASSARPATRCHRHAGQPAGRRGSATSRRFEGMLVQFDQTLTATEVFNLGRFGEVSLSGAGRLYTADRGRRRRALPRSR